MSRTGRGKYPVRYLLKQYYDKFQLWNYPSFDASGSVSGMRRKYYGDEALLVKCGSYIYNVSRRPNIYWNYAYNY